MCFNNFTYFLIRIETYTFIRYFLVLYILVVINTFLIYHKLMFLIRKVSSAFESHSGATADEDILHLSLQVACMGDSICTKNISIPVPAIHLINRILITKERIPWHLPNADE